MKTRDIQLLKIILILLICNPYNFLFATDVFIGHQLEFTSEQRTWTYTAEEAGDYQIGMAWIELESGEDVPVEIFINQKRVKALYGKYGEVTRFETRLEGININDRISVRISPEASVFRSSFTIAFCTPTFDGLPVFYVNNYGAIGDGQSDDRIAIRNAVQAAVNNGGGIVRFDGEKTYRVIGLKDLTEEYLFELNHAKNIKLEGNGATLLLHPPDRLLLFNNCENVQIDGFVVDYDPIPYYQGNITNIDVPNLTVDIEVPERYPVPVVGNTLNRSKYFGKIFIPDAPQSRSGKGPHLFIEETSRINNMERSIRIKGVSTLTDATDALQQALDEGATEVVVPDFNYGHRGQWCGTITGSARIMLSNIHFNMMLRQGLLPQHNTGPISFSNVDILTPNPETELFVSWRGHWLAEDNRYGLLIEDGNWDGGCMYDDLFNIFTRLRAIRSAIHNSITVDNKNGLENWRVGDWVSIWTAKEEEMRGMSRITSIIPSTGTIHLESSISGVTTTDIVINEELKNRGTVVRDCSTTEIGVGTATCRLHTPIHFKNCNFNNTYFWIYSVNDPGTLFEGPRPHDVIFEDSYIQGGDQRTGDIHITQARSVYFKNTVLDGIRLHIRSSERVVFDSLVWINISGDAILLRQSSEGYLLEGSSRNGRTSDILNYMFVDGTSVLHTVAPDNYPEAEPPFLHEIETDMGFVTEPFDVEGETLTGTGSGYGWKDYWTSSAFGITIDKGESLQYPSGVKINPSGGRIFESGNSVSNERSFENHINLASGNLYLSFLARRSASGEFVIETDNPAGHIRFGVNVDKDGYVGIQAGLNSSVSNTILFKDDVTYFVLVKFSNPLTTNAVSRVKLFKVGEDMIPEKEDEIDWDVATDPASTSVDQTKLRIRIPSGTVELDEIIMGSSYLSVTQSVDYEPVSVSDNPAKDNLQVNSLYDGIGVNVPSAGGTLYVYDLFGRALYRATVSEKIHLIRSNVLNHSGTIIIILYELNGTIYTNKKVLFGPTSSG